MRILVLTPTFLPALGGAELVILQVYRRLAVQHSVLVLTPYLPDRLLTTAGSKEYNKLLNFDVHRYHDHYTMIKIRGHRLTFGLIPPFSLSAVGAVKKAANTFKPDVINVHYVMPTGLAGLYADRFLQIPTIITYNGRDVPGPGVPYLWKLWHRIVGNLCTDMTFVSQYCREVIFGKTSHHGHVIYNGVEDPVEVSNKALIKLRSQLNVSPDEHILFSLQRLDFLKRVDVLIRSMPEILSRNPKTRLIIGGQGSDDERLENIARELNIADRVYFAGFIPDEELPVYFAAADLFLFHSTYETFGMVLAEAMNYGKAIVTVSNTAIPEVVDADKTGLLVDTFDSHGFSQAVIRLLNDPQRRKEMAKKGREKAKHIFRWDTIAAKYEKVLEAAIF